MNAPLIRLENVGKRFGQMVAVADLDLQIGRGDFIAIMGPSGCGKTTTLRMLAGLEQPTEGKIYYDEKPIDDVPPWQREMPLVWQNYALFPFLSVLDNVAFGLRSRKVPKKERQRKAKEWLDRLGIGQMADRMPSTLSGGQAQRVALARALVLEPEVLILDEPLSALDAHMVIHMQKELSELQRTLGITFIYVTHNQSEAFAMANKVVIMNKGRVEQVGQPLEVYRAPKTKFVAEFVGMNNIFSGKVASISGDECLINTNIGSYLSENVSEVDMFEGQDVDVVVGADMMTVLREGSSETVNQIDVKFIGESFAGNVVTLVFEARDGEEIKAQVQQRALGDLDLKNRNEIRLSFEPREALLIPKETTVDFARNVHA